MRKDLIPYFGLPFYRAMIERTGFGADIAAYDAAAGDLEAMQAAISDGLPRRADGGRRSVGRSRAGIERYRAGGRELAVRRPDRARPTSRPPCEPQSA